MQTVNCTNQPHGYALHVIHVGLHQYNETNYIRIHFFVNPENPF